MAHGQRKSYLMNKMKELWSRRPMSGYDSNAENKRMCHKIERRKARQKLINIRTTGNRTDD